VQIAVYPSLGQRVSPQARSAEDLTHIVDMEIKVTYQYIESQQPEKRLDALIRFLLEQAQQADQPQEEDNDRSTVLPR